MLGTRIVADVAIEFGAERFVLISTDKARQPEQRDGRDKRSASGSSCRTATVTMSPTRFVAVRFGNVLGSSGSVIPLFRRQIARGRAGDGDPSGDDALLHDDSRSGRSS